MCEHWTEILAGSATQNNIRLTFNFLAVWYWSKVIGGRASGCSDDNQLHLEMLAMILRNLWPVDWVLNGGLRMRSVGDGRGSGLAQKALMKVEYSFQSEQSDPPTRLHWRETLATRLSSRGGLMEPFLARWWPSVQKAKIAGQPTSLLLLWWWWSWKVLAMRTLRADLRAHHHKLSFYPQWLFLSFLSNI